MSAAEPSQGANSAPFGGSAVAALEVAATSVEEVMSAAKVGAGS